MANLARASLALVLRAVFGGAKSCASVNLFMDLPPAGQLMGLTDNDEVLSLITAILWHAIGQERDKDGATYAS
jgi:hypothetical protein